jgi:hypothetical protein
VRPSEARRNLDDLDKVPSLGAAKTARRSTSPLEYATRFDYAAKTTSIENQGKDPSLEAAAARAGDL